MLFSEPPEVEVSLEASHYWELFLGDNISWLLIAIRGDRDVENAQSRKLRCEVD